MRSASASLREQRLSHASDATLKSKGTASNRRRERTGQQRDSGSPTAFCSDSGSRANGRFSGPSPCSPLYHRFSVVAHGLGTEQVPPRNRLLIGHMGSPSLQHLPPSTHSRMTFNCLLGCRGATGASGAARLGAGPLALAPQPSCWRWSTPAASVLGPSAAVLARDSSTASARAAGASAAASASAAAGRDAHRHASCMLCGPCESLDVSHASHTLRQLSHGCVSLRSDPNAPNLAQKALVRACEVLSTVR